MHKTSDLENNNGNEGQPLVPALDTPILRHEEGEIPCFICGNTVTVKRDKNNKLYFICSHCYAQTFVRGKDGMRSFRMIMGEIVSLGASALKARALTTQLAKLVQQRNRIQMKRDWSLFKDESLDEAEKLITSEIQKVQAEIAKLNAKEEQGS